MIITGINNTYSQFGNQLQSDFTGQRSFFVWVVAIGAVGALGYIKDLRTFSHYFMALILVSMVLSNKGLFQNLQAAIAKGPSTPTANTDATQGSSSTPSVPPLSQSPNTPGSTDSQAAGNVAGQATNAITGGNDGGFFGNISKAFTEFLLNPTGATQ